MKNGGGKIDFWTTRSRLQDEPPFPANEEANSIKQVKMEKPVRKQHVECLDGRSKQCREEEMKIGEPKLMLLGHGLLESYAMSDWY